jgi:uncharacterized Zn-binding protein involved in type VI secretion
MASIAIKNISTAGGLIIEGSLNVFINGYGIARDGDGVASHDISPHDAATLIAGSRKIYVNGKRVVVAGDFATCGDVVIATGNVGAGG